MAIKPVIKYVTNEDHLVITPDEHQVPLGSWTRLVDYQMVFYALLPDGTHVALDEGFVRDTCRK